MCVYTCTYIVNYNTLCNFSKNFKCFMTEKLNKHWCLGHCHPKSGDLHQTGILNLSSFYIGNNLKPLFLIWQHIIISQLVFMKKLTQFCLSVSAKIHWKLWTESWGGGSVDRRVHYSSRRTRVYVSSTTARCPWGPVAPRIVEVRDRGIVVA